MNILILAGMSIALALQVSQSVAASVPFETRLQIVQTNSSEAAEKALKEGLEIYQQGTAQAKRKTIAKWQEALKLFQAAGNRSQEAIVLNNIGRIYEELGEQQQALEYYNLSLPLTQTVGDRSQEAIVLNNIGSVYYRWGEQEKALKYYRQSLTLSRAVGTRWLEAIVLANIGVVYSNLGEQQKALDYYSQSLALNRTIGDRSQESTILSNIGGAYDKLGEKQQALDYYTQSLVLSRAVGNLSQEAVTLDNIGAIYDYLGEKQQALEYYERALSMLQAIGDRTEEAITLNNIGKVYDDLGEKEKALKYFSQSLTLKQALGDRSGEAVTLSNIGGIYEYLGQLQQALEYYERSLSLMRNTDNRSGEAITLTNIGNVYSYLGQKQKALQYYSQSLSLSRAVGDASAEAGILYLSAVNRRDRGNLTEALKDIAACIKIIENLRTKIASPELRTSYFASVQDYYEFYIDLLMQLHKKQPSSNYNIKALEASERSRARSLLELLQESNASIREGISPDLLQQEKSLQQQLDAIEKQRIAAVSSPNPNPNSDSNLNPNKIDEIDKQRLALLQQYQQIQTSIRTASPRYAALTQPQPLTLPEIQQQILDDNTILLQYSLGENRSYLWVVTSTEIASYELPKQADIETAARDFLDATTNHTLRDFPKKVAEASSNLSQLILQPVAAQLGNKRLLIVPDGILHYTPFAALTIPQTDGQNTNNFLITQHEIITLPSASTLGILRQNYADRKPPDRTLAILADPVFSPDDDRLKGKLTPETTEKLQSNNLGLSRSLRTSDLAWPPRRLPFTRQETQKILGKLDALTAASSSNKLDFAASRTATTDGSLANYQIVHLATHGIANSQNPELSGILMSMVDETGNVVNGFLRLNDIFNLKLAADLVVLSACQTGLGQNIQGEGIVGLTRGFMYAGAQRVAVSLWNVDDEGTSVLMEKFYQKMLQEKLAPAAALRAAQLEMMREEKWQSPYYWAAFMLQGEWKGILDLRF
ncbi:MAG: CHAT domain-containing tetratricopeptide repeat protein [Microcoleus sp.]